eukprot:9258167-Karenia_brevis.AAC.1
MIKASSHGAPPDAAVVRRYPQYDVYSAAEFESRQEHLRATRDRQQNDQFEESNRMRRELGMPVRPKPST